MARGRIPVTEWRQIFARAARECKEEVAHLPKGERRRAFLECMRRKLKQYSTK